MPAVVLDPMPAELDRLIERRRALGQDRRDEMWEGVVHMSPSPSRRHAELIAQLLVLLAPLARAAGLTPSADFNLGDGPNDFRSPDGGLHRPDAAELWLPTAALVLEIVSPGDETWDKLPFYAAHHVDELLIVDPQKRSIDWLGLNAGAHTRAGTAGAGERQSEGVYRPIERSALIDLGAADLARRIGWPARDASAIPAGEEA